MTRLHQHRIARRTAGALSAGVALLVIAAIAPFSANAAVTCTQTITGTNSGVINVASPNTLCLHGATQDGAVNVAPGAGLSVIASMITGALTLKDKHTVFEFCGSETIQGAISATGAKTATVIGGPGCAANKIDGAVTLTANKAGVTLANNPAIAGGVSATRNLKRTMISNNGTGGAVTATGNLGGTTISNNRIGGALACTGNEPPPTNAGVANAVTGARSGQCVFGATRLPF